MIKKMSKFTFVFFLGLNLFGLQAQDENQEAIELLESAVQKVFDKEFDEALVYFELALAKDVDNLLSHRIYFERAQLKRRQLKDFNGALKDYTKSIELNTSYIQAYVYRGVLYQRNLKNYDAALEDYTKSLELDPNCGACLVQLGYFGKKVSIDDMVGYLDKALDVGVDMNFDGKLDAIYYIYNQLAAIKNYQKDYLGAISYFQRAIDDYQPLDNDGDGKADDNDIVDKSYFSIANIYYEDLDNIEKALYNLDKAIETSPNKDYYKLKAKIKYNDGDVEGALVEYENAKKTPPKTYYNTTYDSKKYYPYIELDRDLDSIDLPISLNTRIEVNDILGLDTTNDQFFMAIDFSVFSKIPPSFLNYKKDSITFFDFEKDQKIVPFFVGSDRLNEEKIKNEGLDDINITEEVIYSGSIETDFFHNWNLKEYPFDTQKLKFQIVTKIDSSIVRVNQSNFFKSNFSNVQGLKEGYKIDKIIFEEKFVEQSAEETFFPGFIRKAVFPVANYSIVISRSGGWLFVKLFLGSFLAFLISWIVFLIPEVEFDSRISLTVGGIFGAISNRYFVDSTIPPVQVLTKADLINNMILALLILNVFIVIIQRNDKINFGILEQNKFAMMFTGLAFVIMNTIIIFW
jgi:tetratricopeptide (TPR) repeat protein